MLLLLGVVGLGEVFLFTNVRVVEQIKHVSNRMFLVSLMAVG